MSFMSDYLMSMSIFSQCSARGLISPDQRPGKTHIAKATFARFCLALVDAATERRLHYSAITADRPLLALGARDYRGGVTIEWQVRHRRPGLNRVQNRHPQ